MKKLSIIAVLLPLFISCTKINNLENIINKNMTGSKGTIVFLDLSSKKKIIYGSNLRDF
jgi:hypothetical protein